MTCPNCHRSLGNCRDVACLQLDAVCTINVFNAAFIAKGYLKKISKLVIRDGTDALVVVTCQLYFFHSAITEPTLTFGNLSP